MKTCEKCGTVNEADVSFCVNCGNKLASHVDAPKNHTHMDMPAQKRPVVVQQKENGKQFCEQCGTANESDVKFCVSCGHNMVGNSNMQYQNTSKAASYMTDEEMMQLRSVPNPVMVIWEKLLFPEKLILIGTLMGCVAAVILGFSSPDNVVLPIFYFLTMVGSLALLYISREASVVKRIELARWQIAFGAFWLAMYITSTFYSLQNSVTYSYAGPFTFGLWLSFFSSIGVLTGAIMLQGILVQHVSNRKNK